MKKLLSIIAISAIFLGCTESEEPKKQIEVEEPDPKIEKLLGGWHLIETKFHAGVYVNGGWGEAYSETVPEYYPGNDLEFVYPDIYYKGNPEGQRIWGDFSAKNDTLFFAEKNTSVKSEYFETYKITSNSEYTELILRDEFKKADGAIDTQHYDSVWFITKKIYRKK